MKCGLFRYLFAGAVVGCLVAVPAHAHVTDRAFVLLLPTHLYAWGGALTVAVSFVVMALIPAARLRFTETAATGAARWGQRPHYGLSYVSLAAIVILIIAGYVGDRDPLSNPLPTVIWTIWWVGFTMVHAVFGNLWSVINPWRGLYDLVTSGLGLDGWREAPPFTYPVRLGFLPAIVLFLAFAWFELVYLSPQDPTDIANAVIIYALITLVGMLVFGERDWLHYGEAFSVFFRIVSWLSPVKRLSAPPRYTIAVPGRWLLNIGILRLSGVVFVLLVLSSVSFDGLSRTFWWVAALAGENPLEYSGRSAVTEINTVGLIGTFAALFAVYVVAVLSGHWLAGFSVSAMESLGRYVVSIVPIAFGYHFAHYLPAFIIDGQYAVRALSDPFALGWDLFGTAGMHVHAAILNNHETVRLVYNLQVGGIVVAHVMAVAVAHLLAMQQAEHSRQAILSQIPMTALMIGYTIFGLWLLSSPTIG